MIPAAAGCYEILNTANGKRYIGSSRNLKQRWIDHRKLLRQSKHTNQILQRAWTKYGEGAFKFLPILTCAPTKQMLMFYEQQLLDKVLPEYNILPTAGTCLGAKRSAEARARMRLAHLGKPVKPRTPEQNAAISERMKGHHRGMAGKKHTPEARAKMAAKAFGRQYGPQSEEHKAKLSKALKGVPRGAMRHEHRLNISAAKKGVPWSIARRAAQNRKMM